jgi:hypothetical protein
VLQAKKIKKDEVKKEETPEAKVKVEPSEYAGMSVPKVLSLLKAKPVRRDGLRPKAKPKPAGPTEPVLALKDVEKEDPPVQVEDDEKDDPEKKDHPDDADDEEVPPAKPNSTFTADWHLARQLAMELTAEIDEEDEQAPIYPTFNQCASTFLCVRPS